MNGQCSIRGVLASAAILLTVLGAARLDAQNGDWRKGVTVVPTAPQTPTGKSWAVLIGINDYDDGTIHDLNFAVRDAVELRTTLVEQCGFAQDHVALLTDTQGTRPTLSNITHELNRLLRQCAQGDTVLLFFSGHGLLSDKKDLYLAPIDCDRDKLTLSGVDTLSLRRMLEQCEASTKIMLLDCCHAAGTKDVGRSTMRSMIAQGVAIINSCGANELSREWPDRQHGLFTYYVIHGLGGHADHDHDGKVKFEELYSYVSDNVSETALKLWGEYQSPTREVLNVQGQIVVASLRHTVRRPIPEPPPEGRYRLVPNPLPPPPEVSVADARSSADSEFQQGRINAAINMYVSLLARADLSQSDRIDVNRRLARAYLTKGDIAHGIEAAARGDGHLIVVSDSLGGPVLILKDENNGKYIVEDERGKKWRTNRSDLMLTEELASITFMKNLVSPAEYDRLEYYLSRGDKNGAWTYGRQLQRTYGPGFAHRLQRFMAYQH